MKTLILFFYEISLNFFSILILLLLLYIREVFTHNFFIELNDTIFLKYINYLQNYGYIDTNLKIY